MRIRSAAEIEDAAAGAEPSNRERRIKAGYRRLLRAVMDGKAEGGTTEKLKSRKQKAEIGRHRKLQRANTKIQRTSVWRPAAADYLSRFLCVGFMLALAVTGCMGPRPLKGGRAVTTHRPAGVIEQMLVQGENPSQATKQDQETVKVRSYTVPAGSRVEQSQLWEGERPREPKHLGTSEEIRHGEIRARGDARPPGSTLNSQPSTTYTLSGPMPVVEREETHARTELGAAQKDTARELGAKLASLKGIVWVGVGLFVFGLASLVWPPLKAVIGSVTTSAALLLGGVVLVVLPSLVVGNELLILGGVGLGVGGWFLAHRHGQLRGLVAQASSPAGSSGVPPQGAQNPSPGGTPG